MDDNLKQKSPVTNNNNIPEEKQINQESEKIEISENIIPPAPTPPWIAGNTPSSPPPPSETAPLPQAESREQSSPSFSSNEGKEEPKQILEEKKKSSVLGKILVFLIILLLVGGVIAGIKIGLFKGKILDKGGIKKGEKITLVYWGLWEPEGVIQPLVEEYQKNNPYVSIKYEQKSIKDYRERLQSSLAKGEGPDIFRFHNTWWPMLKKDLSPAPAEINKEINIEENFLPSVVRDVKKDGKLMAIPLEFDCLSLFYNKRIFKAAGKTPPTNWDELRKTAAEITIRDANGEISVAGVAMGTTNNVDNFSDILGLLLLQSGSDLTNPTDSVAESALKYYTIFVKEDKTWDERLPNSTYAFATEKVAMIFAPSWRAHEIKQINPQLEFATVPVPQLSESKIGWATYWVEGVSAKSKYSKEAWEFLKYLSSEETLTKFYSNAAQIRGFGEPYPRIKLAQQLEEDPIVGAFVKQGSYAQSWYFASRTFDNGINDRMIKYLEDAVNEVLKGKNPSDSLKVAAQGMGQVLGQYGIR